MSTDVISQPSISHRGRRRVLLAALATVAAIGVAGAVTVARSSGGTAGGPAHAGQSAAVVPPPNFECGVDVEYLAAEVGTLSETARSTVLAGLSLPIHQLVDRALVNQASVGTAALQFGFPYSPPVPDGPTLTRALAAIPAADARTIVSGLSPERRAEIGAGSVAASPAGTTCP